MSKNKAQNINYLLLAVENIAQDVLRKLSYDLDSLKLPIDIEKIIAIYSIPVIEKELTQGLSGAVIINENSNKAGIVINKIEHYNRKRFTLAHELGHFISYTRQNKTGIFQDYFECSDLLSGFVENKYDKNLSIAGRPQQPRNDISKIGKDLEEIFANRFAAAVLMPKNLVELELHRMQNFEDNFERNIQKIAKKFGVSETAMRFRLLNI
jgi:Zn-dependent peptidase ImmA (M78 family)